MLTPVPAALSTKDYVGLMQNCLVIPVNHAEYQNAERLSLAQLKAMALTVPKSEVYGVYGLTPDDCAVLMVTVLQTLPKKGVLVPERFASEPALAYMRRLIDQNLRRSANL